mmetsp:Transcript_3068/g.7035  ORF Transcript_3068/g.7035 Transcript_3068/m.7035 type:complete len:249 (+) Transcript_3068:137-883(+)
MERVGRLVHSVLMLARVGHQLHHKPMDGIVRPPLLEGIDEELAQILQVRVDGDIGRNLGLLATLHGRKCPRRSHVVATNAPIADGIILLLVRERDEAGLHGRSAAAVLGLRRCHSALHEEFSRLDTGDGEVVLLPHNGGLHVVLVLVLVVGRFVELLLLLEVLDPRGLMRRVADGLHHDREGNVHSRDGAMRVQLRPRNGTAQGLNPIFPLEMLPGDGTLLRGMFKGQVMLHEKSYQLIDCETADDDN